MNKANMRLALKAFEGCKQYLNTPRKHDCEYFICRAIDEWYRCNQHVENYYAANIACDIVMRSIDPYFTMGFWVARNAHIPKMHLQARRHLFVDACIEELKRSIDD